MSIIKKTVSFVNVTTYESIPDEIKKMAHRSLTDYIAVTISGAASKEADIVNKYIEQHVESLECSLIGKKRKAAAEDAALCNGTYAHAQDFDDASLVGHPSAVLYSAAFAAAEKNRSSGKELVRAYILGYEVALKIADALMPKLTNNGWHGTSVFGTIGATLVSGILYNLTDDELENALGIAASRASGLMINFGTGTKPFHAGMAARNGIECALLAKCGITSSKYAIEGPDGYAHTFAQAQLEPEQVYFGGDWSIYKQDLLIKKYPCCSAAHAANNAVAQLKKENDFHVEQIHSIDVAVPEFTLRNLIYPEPENETQARFSMQYSLANILLYDELNLDSYSDAKLADADTRLLMSKIDMHEGKEFRKTPYIDNEPAVVTIALKNGDKFTKRVDFAAGTTVNPLSESEMYAKFQSCTKQFLAEEEQPALYFELLNITKEKNIDRILKYL